MPNIFEAVVNTFKSFVDNEPKHPLHIGESMQCWSYLVSLEEALEYEEAAHNTTTDRMMINPIPE